MKHRASKNFPVGTVTLEEENGRLVRVWLRGKNFPPADATPCETPLLQQAFRELDEYFCGKRTAFATPLEPRGTPFQLRVWEELCKVKFGETTTYGELAKRAGFPNAARAVGGAMNKNPLAIFIPCHRVIGANGSLTGFGAGLPVKRKLLALENVRHPPANHRRGSV